MLHLKRLALATGLVALAISTSLAAEPVRLKVMSFNIWYGGDQVSFAKVVEAIRAADPDLVGLQETDGSLARLSAETGLPYYDVRRNILSRYPIFDPARGERQAPGSGPYSMPALDVEAIAAYVLVAPGQVVAMANTHLTSDPYGPYAVRDGATPAEALAVETATRLGEAQLLADGLGPLIASGMPVFLTGDFNSPSHLDWVAPAVGVVPSVKFPLEWPVSRLFADTGFADSYRSVHTDPATRPGATWTAGAPAPIQRPDEVFDRIDWVLSAHATALASEVVGEVGGPDVDLGISPWPSDHRAVVSTFEVVPQDAPALIAVEPARVVGSADFVIRANLPGFPSWSAYVVPRGGNAATDTITGIGDVPMLDRPSVRLTGRALAPGAYDAVLLDADGVEQARTQFYVVAADTEPKLWLDKADYAVGETITVNWSGTMGERFEWLGTYPAGEPNVYNYLSFTYTGGHVDGSRTITAEDYGDPLPAGAYELRLLRDDAYGLQALARFTVR